MKPMNPHPQHSGHTPGPWKTILSPTCGEYVQLSGGTFAKRKIGAVWHQANEEESEANARLIAAAPALLEACKDAAQALAALYHRMGGDLTEQESDAHDKCLRAISQAEDK